MARRFWTAWKAQEDHYSWTQQRRLEQQMIRIACEAARWERVYSE